MPNALARAIRLVMSGLRAPGRCGQQRFPAAGLRRLDAAEPMALFRRFMVQSAFVKTNLGRTLKLRPGCRLDDKFVRR